MIDTTGSMGDDIAQAREVINEIIDSKKGTQDEPSDYILVPFNDPGKKNTFHCRHVVENGNAELNSTAIFHK